MRQPRIQESFQLYIFANLLTLYPILTKYTPLAKPETSSLTPSPIVGEGQGEENFVFFNY
jgi:hypothetical protein